MKRKFINNEFYHVFNRGVDKRKIYNDNSDYLRFIYDLYEFNDTRPAPEFSRVKGRNVGNTISHTISHIASRKEREERDLLVKVHAFVLMPSHHHLLVEQVKESGVSLFMAKLHGGYSRAFNAKHKRSGHLFQGLFKYVHIKDDIHLGFLICYLHSNPLDLWKSNWKKNELTDQEIEQALKFLRKYKWSSHLDYQGTKSFPSLIDKKFLLEFFDGTQGYKKFLVDWLQQYKKNIKHVENLIF